MSNGGRNSTLSMPNDRNSAEGLCFYIYNIKIIDCLQAPKKKKKILIIAWITLTTTIPYGMEIKVYIN
jgi:hypothetical protein